MSGMPRGGPDPRSTYHGRVPPAAAALETVALVLALLPVLLLLASGPALLHPRARPGPNLAALGIGVVLAVAVFLGWRIGVQERGTLVAAIAVVALLLVAQVGYVLAVLLLRWAWLARSVRRHPPMQAEALVVLGAGLVGTRVTLVLAERLLAAVRLHGSLSLPAEPESRPVPLVVSGGQGPDEVTSEAAAMAAFLVDHGVDPAAILLEDCSTSTEENLVLSAGLVAGLAPSGIPGRIVVVTNGFHVFRTDLLARALRLDVVVVGSATPLHYLPRALVRELAAVLLTHPRRHLAAAALLVALGTWAGLG